MTLHYQHHFIKPKVQKNYENSISLVCIPRCPYITEYNKGTIN